MSSSRTIRHLSPREWMGWGCLVASAIFLTINSNILARGAARWAEDYWDKVSYAIIAAMVPWIIAITPFIILWAWKTRHRIWSIVGGIVYIIFIVYNILGAGGAIAVVRNEAVSTKVYGAKIEKRDDDVRSALVERRETVAKTTRPPRQLATMLEAERAKPFWERTTNCTAPETRKEQKLCAEYYKIATELGAAEELQQIDMRIAQIDSRSIERGPISTNADPQARFISRWAGVAGFSLNEELVGELLPLATPTVLEAGSMTLAAFGILLLGFNHGALNSGVPTPLGAPGRGDGSVPQRALPPPLAPLQFVEAWFAAHSRHALQGSLSEDEWYAYYAGECSRSNVAPMSRDGFRSVASKHGAVVNLVDGRYWYSGILPVAGEQ